MEQIKGTENEKQHVSVLHVKIYVNVCLFICFNSLAKLELI